MGTPFPIDYKDWYQILGVQKDASSHDIKNAYENLSQELQTDSEDHQQLTSNPEFKLISKARDVLLDANARKRFDQDYNFLFHRPFVMKAISSIDAVATFKPSMTNTAANHKTCEPPVGGIQSSSLLGHSHNRNTVAASLPKVEMHSVFPIGKLLQDAEAKRQSDRVKQHGKRVLSEGAAQEEQETNVKQPRQQEFEKKVFNAQQRSQQRVSELEEKRQKFAREIYEAACIQIDSYSITVGKEIDAEKARCDAELKSIEVESDGYRLMGRPYSFAGVGAHDSKNDLRNGSFQHLDTAPNTSGSNHPADVPSEQSKTSNQDKNDVRLAAKEENRSSRQGLPHERQRHRKSQRELDWARFKQEALDKAKKLEQNGDSSDKTFQLTEISGAVKGTYNCVCCKGNHQEVYLISNGDKVFHVCEYCKELMCYKCLELIQPKRGHSGHGKDCPKKGHRYFPGHGWRPTRR